MSTVNATEAFPEGTFAPAPARAGILKMITAQGRIESALYLRHGEQQLLNLVIPVAIILAVAFLPLLDEPNPLTVGLPMTLAIAATSAGFTGEAIALAFDRRHGALKRIGASGVPLWVIVAGKIIAVATMVSLQTVLLCTVAAALGWRVSLPALIGGILMLWFGAAIFTSLGLLMGGTLSAELVLAASNLIWLLLAGVVGAAYYATGLDAASWFDVVPSVALASGLVVAFGGGVPWAQLISLIVWGAFGTWATARWFQFTS